MKNILLGLMDYLKDCWHDFWYCFWGDLGVFAFDRLEETYCHKHNNEYTCKEGNVFHYIKQRRLANKHKSCGKQTR